MARPVGIDLGTSNSTIATYDHGRTRVIRSAEGGRATPSVVGYAGTGRPLVGGPARIRAAVEPHDTIASAKRFLGRRYEDVAEIAKDAPYDVVPTDDGSVRFTVRGRLISPEEVCARVLRQLADDVAERFGNPVAEAVLAVPAHFDDAQRQATRDAGRIAGLEVTRVINETTAAALAYGLGRRCRETVLVFDLGAGTFGVSVVDVGHGIIEVRAAAGDSRLGGDDFDRAIADHLADGFGRDTGVDLRQDPRALRRLLAAAERAKIELSSTARTRVSLPAVVADSSGVRDLTATLTRSTLERLTDDLVQRCLAPVRQAIADAGVGPDELDEVILVGGATRMPAVRALARTFVNGRPPMTSPRPDEMVARGAAIQAAVMGGAICDALLWDVTTASVTAEVSRGRRTVIAARNTAIPVARTAVFPTARAGQPVADIVVRPGPDEDGAGDRVLGLVPLENVTPGPNGPAAVDIMFRIDADGILSASARDADTGAERRITIVRPGTLDVAELRRLVTEARRDRARRRPRGSRPDDR